MTKLFFSKVTFWIEDVFIHLNCREYNLWYIFACIPLWRAVLYSSQYLLSLVIWFAIVNSILYITLSIIWRSLYKLVSILRSTYTSYICMFSFLYLRAMNKWNVERAWNWYVRNRRMYFTNNDIITDGFKSYTICHMEWKLSWVTLFDGNGGHARSVF